MANQEKKGGSRVSGRSPAYPAIDLKDAVRKAEVIFKAEGRHAAAYPTIVKKWGYAPKSGPGRLAFAALMKFGLIELVGKGEGITREARITETAQKIILDARPNSEDRRRELQAAALRPAVHRRLWDQYAGSLPSDDNLIYQLRMSGFTETGARGLVEEFRSTLAFAGVGPSTIIPAEAGSEDDDGTANEDEGEGGMSPATAEVPKGVVGQEAQLDRSRSAPTARAILMSGPHVRFPLSGDNVLEISLRTRVTRREFDKIKKLVELAEDSFVDEAPPE